MDSEVINFLVIFSLLMISLKLYLGYGLTHVIGRDKKKWSMLWTLCSIIIYAMGLGTLLGIMKHQGVINMTFWPNFRISLMVSVLICEIFLLGFYFLDDIVRFCNLIYRKIRGEEKGLAEVKTQENKSRRRFIKTAGTALTAIPFASFLYGITIGKYSYKVFRETLTFADLPAAFDGLKIVQFSDLHSGSFDSAENVKRGAELMQSENPDLILFTGDLVNSFADEVLPYKEIFGKLNATIGKYSILGNHDYPSRRSGGAGNTKLTDIEQHHKDMDFRLLKNENVKIERNGESIRLVGVENWSRDHYFGKHGDLNKAVADCEKGDFTILMSHDPTHWDEEVKTHDHHVHLTLSGHTHGMQMGIELAWFKFSPAQFKFSKWAGLYKELGQYLYINRGFGFLGFAGRVGIPPEITVFELKKA